MKERKACKGQSHVHAADGTRCVEGQSEATQRAVRSGFALREVEHSLNECQIRCRNEAQCLTLPACSNNKDINYRKPSSNAVSIVQVKI
jgi:hypothetical protein